MVRGSDTSGCISDRTPMAGIDNAVGGDAARTGPRAAVRSDVDGPGAGGAAATGRDLQFVHDDAGTPTGLAEILGARAGALPRHRQRARCHGAGAHQPRRVSGNSARSAIAADVAVEAHYRRNVRRVHRRDRRPARRHLAARP